MMAASSPATRFWRDRGTLDWARVLPTYWDASAQPHRQAMMRALRALPKFHSLRELGCCAGTNLSMVRHAFPWVAVEGVDVSQQASIFAQDKLASDPACRVVCADILTEADIWEPGEVDVTLTCYTLAYVAPDDLPDLLAKVIRATAQAVVFVEPMYGEAGRIPVHYTAEWRHDYVRVLDPLLRADGRAGALHAVKLDEAVEACDGLLTVTFT